jgi:hypothetical protein
MKQFSSIRRRISCGVFGVKKEENGAVSDGIGWVLGAEHFFVTGSEEVKSFIAENAENAEGMNHQDTKDTEEG